MTVEHSTRTAPPKPPALRSAWGTIADAAERWDVSTKTVRRWIARGEVQAVRLPGGRLLRVNLESIQTRPMRSAS